VFLLDRKARMWLLRVSAQPDTAVVDSHLPGIADDLEALAGPVRARSHLCVVVSWSQPGLAVDAALVDEAAAIRELAAEVRHPESVSRSPYASAQYHRRGRFERLFPEADSGRILRFFEIPRRLNDASVEHLARLQQRQAQASTTFCLIHRALPHQFVV
jgi:hypothetical protein